MRPRDDNVIPFRRKRRKWTGPEDYGAPGSRLPAPAAQRAPDEWRRARRTLAVWGLILVLIALTVAWSARDLLR